MTAIAIAARAGHDARHPHVSAPPVMATAQPKERPRAAPTMAAPARRVPRQLRSQAKVEFMLEAAMQLLDETGLDLFTTKAVAAKAGVSIGTLYQYFDDKQALLDALVARELGAMADKVVGAMKGKPPAEAGERIRRIARAVVGAYGGRGRVHRMLMDHALGRLTMRPLSPMYPRLMALLTSPGVEGPDRAPVPLSEARAFVLTHATAGVLRTLVASERTPPVREVEDALVELVLGYLERPAAHPAPERAA